MLVTLRNLRVDLAKKLILSFKYRTIINVNYYFWEEIVNETIQKDCEFRFGFWGLL